MEILDILGEEEAASDELGDLGQAFFAALDPKGAYTAKWKSPFGRTDVKDSGPTEGGKTEK